MKEQIAEAITRALQELGLPEVEFVVDYPTDKNAQADYFSNVALVLSKQVGKSPHEIAEQFRAVLADKLDQVDSVEVAGPGFLNFQMDREFFKEKIGDALATGEQWGKNDTWAGKQVVIEYTSPNLFKPLHIGNLVGNIIGETLSRLFEMNGAIVTRFNYPSDIGLTVAKGVWGLKHTGGDANDILMLGEAYRQGNEAYEAGGEAAEEIKAINKALYEGTDAELSALREAGIATSKRRLAELLHVLGTTFDREIPESHVSAPGAEIVRAHIGDVFTESDGAVVYEGDRSGLHTRVFLNSGGLPTYEAKDIGHFKLKHETHPDWDYSIIVTGNEQAEYFKVVFAAIRELFDVAQNRTLEHIPTGFLTLTTGKMSSRKGNVLTGESLLEEMEAVAHEKSSLKDETLSQQIGVAALKYQILKHSVGSNIVFDKEKALSFEGDSGPYLQYTYARIQSVLEKAAQAGVEPSTQFAPLQPYAVEKLIERFPSVIAAALASRAPHMVTGYLTELAGAFNSFYAEEKIADATDEFAPYKAAVADAVALTLKQGLWTLGIKAPERM
ncbi:arginine--tRNA ligase [Candidatus Kaiserbacteria bacterium]|nr:arginine--tRNA ligase [Candidatus Kaiserbacteria bacterium]